MAEDFLSRWSKRKSEARVAAAAPPGVAPAVEPAIPEARAEPAQPQPLPPVESLTPESDFTGFMKPEVDEGLKRQALRTLFRDPHFNVMDGLDIYIDDYSKPDPLPESWLGQLKQMERLGAYVEPDAVETTPEEGVAEARDGTAEGAEAPEKPSAEQGLAESPSSDTSHTPASGDAPPTVP